MSVAVFPPTMPTPAEVRRTFRFNREVQDRFEACLKGLPWRTVAKDRGATYHSMAGVFHHVLLVYDGWLNFVVQGERADQTMVKKWDALESMAEIQAFREDVWRCIDPVLKGLTPGRLLRKVKAPWQPKACTLADAFAQVTLEQAYHFGEIIAMLWQEDIEPPTMGWLETNWRLAARRRSG